MSQTPQFRPRKQLSENPRRVRSGIKLSRKNAEPPESWAAKRWLGLVEDWSGPDEREEGLEYAQIGQTRKLDLEPGVVRGSVQGRAQRAYQVNIEFKRFDAEAWDRAVALMAGQAIHAARLLAGELPPGIEEALEPGGIHLFPKSNEVHVSCTCGFTKTNPGGWCKHACCLAQLVADRMEEQPFVVFGLRGLEPDDLLERLRQARVAAGVTDRPQPVYSSTPNEPEPVPLDDVADRFWQMGEIEGIDLPVEPPAVRQPLLRRLGPSPFSGSRFPLVGLLATCYDLISEAAVRRAENGDENGDAEGESADGD